MSRRNRAKTFQRYHAPTHSAYDGLSALTRSCASIAIVLDRFALHAQDITSKDLLDGLANPSRWLTHSGDYTGHRFSPLTQITPANVGQLAAQWTFQTGVVNKFEATPIVIDGTLYVTGALNHAWAIDGRTGKQIWHYQRTLPAGSEGVLRHGEPRLCRLRRSAVHGDARRAFRRARDENRQGDLRHRDGHRARTASPRTGAPLIVKDKVIVGVAGGEFANRGFIDAYDPATGERLWRFYTIPAPGEPGSDTWQGEIWQRGGGPTWLTGTYDPALNLLYWGTGNPNPDWDGESRPGDNLYTDSLVALDPDTGTLKWHFQFTPHDTHDWDANEVPVLADLTIGGRPRKVVMMANRNGFFYVHDRADRRVPARQAVRQHDVGEARSAGRQAARAARISDPTRSRHHHVPGLVRRHQLHVAVVRRRPRAVLRHGARDVRALHRRPPRRPRRRSAI